MRPVLCATLIPVLSIACSVGHAGEKHRSRTFSEKASSPISQTLEASKKLVVEYLDGSIEVTGTSGGHVVVTGTRTDQADSKDKLSQAAQDVKLAMEAKDGTARVIVEGPWRSSHPKHRENWSQDYRVVTDFKVQVPADAEVTLTAVNGGTMTVKNVRGALRVTNVNGNIQAEGLAGASKLTTVNGTVDVTFQQAPTGGCTFTTVNGTVKLKAPASLNADLKLNTVHGEMVTDFPDTDAKSQSKNDEHRHGFRIPGVARKLRLGNGGTAITCTTVNGDLVIKKL